MNAINTLAVYNPAIKDKEALINEFVVRTKTFEQIISDLKSSDLKFPGHDYLIIGQRGSGKTTLLHRIKYAIDDDNTMNSWIIPILFTEEQYYINSLEDLWLEITEQLRENYHFDFNQTKDAFEDLSGFIKKNNKQLLLLIDNVNDLFKKLSEIEIKKLRNILMNNAHYRLIGTSSTYFDGIFNYSEPFFEFFKIVQLEGLESEEMKNLLLKLGDLYYDKKTIEKIIKSNPERIEILKRLTGGVPRTIVLLFQIFMDDSNGKSIKDLQLILDAVTPIYKAKIDDLSFQQQKIIDAVAKNWDPITTKELVDKTKLESKIISSQLRQLEKNQIIEKIVQENTKNHMYRLKERFLNIWYLMRYGRKSDRTRVIWLVKFLETWCDKLELEKRLLEHIDNLKKGVWDSSAALIMAETFISCHEINPDLKYDLVSTTKKILPQLSRELNIADQDLIQAATVAFEKKEFSKVTEIADEIKKKDFYVNTLIGYAFIEIKKFKKALNYLEAAAEMQEDSEVLFNIGVVYEKDYININKAREFYERAAEQKNYRAAHRLGHIMDEYFDEKEKSIFYFHQAIDGGDKKAIPCLGRYYLSLRRLDDARKIFLKGIQAKIPSSYDGMGIVSFESGNEADAENYFKKSYNLGYKDGLVNLARFYLRKKDPDEIKAVELLEKGVRLKNVRAYYSLGKILMNSDNKQDNKRGLELMEQATKKNVVEASHHLGHYYADNDNYNLSEKYFMQAINAGDFEASLCLSMTYLANAKKKQYALKLLQSAYPRMVNEIIYTELLLATLLLWNNLVPQAFDEFEKYMSNILNTDNEGGDYDEVLFFLLLLIAKEQYQYALKVFRNGSYKLDQKYKPAYFALVTILKKELPNEYLKISKEYKETVTEIIDKIKSYKKKYV